MRRIGIEETVPMCRLVEVSEKDNPLQRFEGQTVNMDEVNFFAKRMESLTEYDDLQRHHRARLPPGSPLRSFPQTR